MFIVTHDPNHILWFCDSVVVLGKEGTIISQGKPGVVLSKDLLEVIYGDLCDVKHIYDNSFVVPNMLQRAQA